ALSHSRRRLNVDDVEQSELLTLRAEVMRLRALVSERSTDRASWRAALNLMEDAIAARREAEAASRAKDEFLAIIGHELRTPLAAITLWASALRSGTVPPDDVAHAIDAIANSAHEQSHLIENLLDLSRLTSGRAPLHLGGVDVRALAQSAIDVIAPTARARSITVSCVHDAPEVRVMLDITRVKQILWNILGNAMKFTPDGGNVRVATRKRERWLEIAVVDSGEGIAPEFLPFVFERFRQADMGETRSHGGLGIGLAIAKQLAELHGGGVVAESEGHGRGATFVVRLPWRDAFEEDVVTPRPPDPTALANVRVLLVEDDDKTSDAMRWVLEQVGASVVVAKDADRALGLLDGDDVDVIVSDLGLPGKSGYDLIAAVIERHVARGTRPPPSCAVSAHTQHADRRRAIDAGFDIYLAKPVGPERLIEAVIDLRGML
ncbi:MAG TPA: ATP-binding protein, partial [Polyangiaceae bacterium]